MSTNTRLLISLKALFACLIAAPLLASQPPVVNSSQPNIVILMTDDQGYGDLGFHGNPHLKTPNIDAFARESIGFTRFYVSPVCAPTRASLLTGRYNYRTGVTDTWFGRATMLDDEVTLAETLQEAGYATALFGKWHLGDTFPYRPQDQGFGEVLMHRGGGIGQPSDAIGNSYFDPILWHNGNERTFKGYCMDVYTDAAIDFIQQNKDQPFFVYLATNTPHSPLETPDHYTQPYLDAGLPEETSKVYGMITNIDDNFARVLKQLDELGLSENTIVIYMSDNGPRVFTASRHLAGLNGAKTDVMEGGIRSPFFLRWPARFKQADTIETIAAHIDIMPTLLGACGLESDSSIFDGVSLLPLMQRDSTLWPARTLFFQWHRGDAPTPYRNFTAVGTRYKLLQNQNKFKASATLQFELYDLEQDPGETLDIAAQHPEVVQSMRAQYDVWLADVAATRGFPEAASWVGSSHENPVVLTQQDRRDAPKWGDDQYYSDAYWPIKIVTAGNYEVTFDLFAPAPGKGQAILMIGEQSHKVPVERGAQQIRFTSLLIKTGEYRLSGYLESRSKKTAPRFIDIELIDTQ